MAIRENSSGRHKGESRISKRGRRCLRTALFQAVLGMVKSNEEFRELHMYYTTRRNNPLKKKQSLIVLCCKLIRIIYSKSVKGFHYDGQKLLGDIKRPLELTAA